MTEYGKINKNRRAGKGGIKFFKEEKRKMRQKKRRFFSLILTWLMLCSAVLGITPGITLQANAAEISTVAAVSSSNIEAQDDIQDGVTLHCWNWSYNNITANLDTIAAQGYTAIQTSPIQFAKEATTGKSVGTNWWVYYQPAGFFIDNTGNSALGTKAEFENMCQKAHEKGIKVIVDVVANHMGNQTRNNLATTIVPDIRNDASCWHDITKNTTDYSNRYDITQHCMDGLPDLNTGSSKIQNYVLNYLKECIDAGVDGFRFDGAKHIETPEDSSSGCGSNFWPTVINGATSYAKSTRNIDLYCYGEVLDAPDSSGKLPITAYTKYMSVTDNQTGNDVRNNVNSGNASSAASSSYYKAAAGADKLVLWAESHDTYADNKSSGVSTENINKTWAIVAARTKAMDLYFARPYSRSSKLGDADRTGWANAEVAAVNKFHNAFVGQEEYMSAEGSIAYCERGTSGVVLVNCNTDPSKQSVKVNVKATQMASGTYKDQITGETFTVQDGRISGKIGNTGIAVVYNAETNPTASISPNGGNFSSDTYKVTVGMKNADSATYQVGNKAAQAFNGTKEITIGEGMEIGDSVTVTVVAVKGDKQDKVSYTFTKVEKSENIAYIKLPSGWSEPVYCYAYDSATETKNNGVWPGEKMTSEGNGIYSCEISEEIEAPRVIFYSSNINRYPADMEDGLLLNGSMIYKDGSWESYTPAESGSVEVAYVDEAGNQLADSEIQTGLVGSSYVTTAKPISGYTLKTTPDNASGIYVKGIIKVTYVYEKSEVVAGNTAYIELPSGWGSDVYCYVYSQNDESVKNAAWPGVKMTKVSGNIYKYDVPDTIANPLVIFNDKNQQYPASMQKGLSLKGSMIYQGNQWKTYTGGVVETKNIAYFKKPANWKSDVYCYVYSADNESVRNSAWPGVKMTVNADGTYQYEVSNDIANPLVIFTDGTNQCPAAMQKGLSLKGSMIYDNGSWSIYQ